MTPLAASPASFQPSKAAMITGEVSLPMPSSSITHHLLACLGARCRGSRLRLAPDRWVPLPPPRGPPPPRLVCSPPYHPHPPPPPARPPRRAAEELRAALARRVVVADGAMGTMLQASPATLGDFDGHEGCNEILNFTRPDIVRSIHDAYLEAGSEAITTNTFGANLGNLGEYGIESRIEELSEAGARIAPAAAAGASTGRDPRGGPGPIRPGTQPARPVHL